MDLKKTSGTFKRKLKKIRDAKEAIFLKRIPSISNFFVKPLDFASISTEPQPCTSSNGTAVVSHSEKRRTSQLFVDLIIIP